MKKIIPFIILFAGCSGSKTTKTMLGNHYLYVFDMVAPAHNSALRYETENLKFDFTFKEKVISFSAYNKSPEVLKVNWDEASLAQLGKTKHVMHNGVKYSERNSSMPPTSIPPNSTLQDFVVPSENIFLKEDYGPYESSPEGWETEYLFLPSDFKKEENRKAIYDSKGQELTLYLPFKNPAGQELGYTFTFKIRDVVCTTCKL